MTRIRTGLPFCFTPLCLILLEVCCSRAATAEDTGPLILARYAGGVVTAEDMNRKLEYIPADARYRIVTETNAEEWLDGEIREIAVLRELAQRARRERLAEFSVPLREKLERDRCRILTAAVREKVWSDCTPSLEDEMRYYERNREQFRAPGVVEFQYIFTNPENGGEKAASERIERADALIQSGSDFQEVARLCSQTGAPPDMLGKPTEVRLDEPDPVIISKLEELAPGECSSPFRSNKGFHIVKLLDLRPSHYEAFEKVENRIRYELTSQCARETGDAIDRRVAARYPAEISEETLEDPGADPDTVVIRCGTYTAPLGYFLHEKSREDRMTLVQEVVSEFRLASYAAEISLGQTPEVVTRISDAETENLGEAMRETIVKGEVSPPTGEETRAYYEENRQQYRYLPRASGGMMRFDAVFAVGASRKDQYEALMRAKERALQARKRLVSGEEFAAVAADLEPPDTAEAYDLAESHGALFDFHTADLGSGEVSEPVGRKLSWYLFWKREEIPPREKNFDEVREEVRQDLLEDRVQAATERLYGELADKIGLEINREAVAVYLQVFGSQGSPAGASDR